MTRSVFFTRTVLILILAFLGLFLLLGCASRLPCKNYELYEVHRAVVYYSERNVDTLRFAGCANSKLMLSVKDSLNCIYIVDQKENSTKNVRYAPSFESIHPIRIIEDEGHE